MLSLVFNRLNAGSSLQATQSSTAAGRVEYHAIAGSSQASQSTAALGRVVYHAGSVTAQASQSAIAAGRLVYHAGAATTQGSQSATAAGRLVYHSAGITAQASQAMTAFGRVEYHATGGWQQASQATQAAGRVVYHAGAVTLQSAQSMAALGLVIPFVGVIGSVSSSQPRQSMAAFGVVTNPVAPAQPGGNVWRAVHAYAAGDFGPPIQHVRGNGSSVQAAQITEARGRAAPMSSFHVPDTDFYVFEEGRAAGRQPEEDAPLPLPVANSPTPALVASNEDEKPEVTDDELAFIFAIAA